MASQPNWHPAEWPSFIPDPGLLARRRLHLFRRPVSLAVKGPSSAGKSYLVERVVAFFPTEAVYELTAMSEKTLVYSKEPLAHRTIVLYEAVALNSDFASYLVRTLLSEGRLVYEFVEKTNEGLRSRRVEREGPAGFITTTTLTRLHAENETRLLTIVVDDTQQQTQDVMLAQALAAAGAVPRTVPLERWHALQHWLANGPADVVIPFAPALAAAIPPLAVRLRRDFPALLALIEAHALLHQASRGRDAEGRIVATLDDYAVVRALVAQHLSDAVQMSVPPKVRETVDAVARLAPFNSTTTVKAVATALGLDKSSASRRVQDAIALGYLDNLESRAGRPALLKLGEPMPADRELLPRPEALAVDAEPFASEPLHGCSTNEGDAASPPPGEAEPGDDEEAEYFEISA